MGDSLQVIYNDGSSRPFSLPRLTVSLSGFLTHHHDQAADEAYWLSETIYQLFMKRGNGGQAIPIHELLKECYGVLERFDALAGLQFAAKYKLIAPTRKSAGRPRLRKN